MKRRFLSQIGSAGLETILSVMLMLGAFYCMWGVSLIIYNKTKLTTASQFASRGALTVYQDQGFRGEASAAQMAATTAAAQQLLLANTTGMARDQFQTGSAPNVVINTMPFGSGVETVSITCSSRGRGSDDLAFSGDQCSSGNRDNADVTRIIVRGCTVASYWLLNPLSTLNSSSTVGRGGSLTPSTICDNSMRSGQIRTTSRSYMYAPEDTAN